MEKRIVLGKYALSLGLLVGGITPLFGHIATKDKSKVTNTEIHPVDTSKTSLPDQILSEVVINGMIRKFADKKSEYVSRMPLKNLENPQVYTVVPKELFQEEIAVDFRNVLTASPGVQATMISLGSGGTGLSMRLRGFAGANGAGSIRNGMATNFSSLSDPANLESVEIIKGPSATLFGTTLISYGGLINRVTKKAYDGTGGTFSLISGSWGLARVTGDFNTPLDKDGKVLFRVNTALQREGSFQDYGVNKSFLVAPTLTFKPTDRLTLTLDGEYFNSNRNTTYINLTSKSKLSSIDQVDWDWKKSFASNDITSKAEVLNLFAGAVYQISEHWTSHTLFSYSRTSNDANYLFLDVNSKDSLSRRLMHIPSIFMTQQLQQNFNGDFLIGNIRNRILLGLDYTKLTTSDTRSTLTAYDKSSTNATGNIAIGGGAIPMYLDRYNTLMATPNKSVATRRSTRTYSAYVSDVINLTDRWDVMGALRFDRFNDIENDYLQSAWSPKFGMVYQIIKNQVSAFINYMNGFSNQGPAVGDADGNTRAFKPEHANQWEGGIKLELLGRRLSSTLSVYHIKVADRIRTVTAPEGSAVASYSVQDGTEYSKGFEMDLIANPLPGMHIIMGYGHNENQFQKGTADGKREIASPKHLANFWIGHKFVKGTLQNFGLGLGGNFASSSFLDSNNQFTIPGYGKLDATIFFETLHYRFGIKVNNLTDKHYYLGNYYAELQAPRQFLANLTYRF